MLPAELTSLVLRCDPIAQSGFGSSIHLLRVKLHVLVIGFVADWAVGHVGFKFVVIMQ